MQLPSDAHTYKPESADIIAEQSEYEDSPLDSFTNNCSIARSFGLQLIT